jgi:hypothetical protein
MGNLDKKWKLKNMIQNAIESAHNTPSAETRERLKSLEVKQQNIMQELQDLKLEAKEQHLEIKKLLNDMKLDIKCELDKKANAWVETYMKWFLLFVASGILTLLGTLIYQAIVHFN